VSNLQTYRNEDDDGFTVLGYDLASMVPTVHWWQTSNPLAFNDDDEHGTATVLPSLLKWATLKAILPTACTVSVVAIVESVNTVESVLREKNVNAEDNGAAEDAFGPDLNLEVVMLGVATALSGFLGGQAGAAFKGQQPTSRPMAGKSPKGKGQDGGTGDNDDDFATLEAGEGAQRKFSPPSTGSTGGQGRVSVTAAAVCTFLLVHLGARVLNALPTAGLVGILLSTCAQHYFSYESLKMVCATLLNCLPSGTVSKLNVCWGDTHKVSQADAWSVLLVSVGGPLCGNLAVGLVAGCVVCAFAFAMEAADKLTVEVLTPSSRLDRNKVSLETLTKAKKTNKKVYVVTGQIYFASAGALRACFAVCADPSLVEVRLQGANVCDSSAVQALNSLAADYQAVGKHLRLRHLKRSSVEVLSRSCGLLGAFTGGDPGGGKDGRRRLLAGLKASGAIGTDKHGKSNHDDEE